MVVPSSMSLFMLFKQELAPLLAAGAATGGLWARLPLVTVVELMGASSPYEEGHLERLLGYAHLCRANEVLRPACGGDLGVALVMPERTSALLVDVAELGLRWTGLGPGCWQLHGGLFPIHVIEANRVTDEDEDELLLFLVDQARSLGAREVN